MSGGPLARLAKRSFLVGLVLVAGVTAASAMAGGLSSHSAPNRRQRGSVLLGGSPGYAVANPRTHTLYVALQCRNDSKCLATTQHVLDIIDTSRCNAKTVSGCRVVGRAEVGKQPLGVAVDEKTDTIYVADSSGAVSVVDGGRCNATVRTDCRSLATIKTEGGDVADALDPRTHTLYVAGGPGVFVINVARCNARTTRGCHQRVRKVKDAFGPVWVGLDPATNTVYTGNVGLGRFPIFDVVSVISGARCNGSTGGGCGQTPREVTVGSNPFSLAVDQATDTVYVANWDDGAVSVLDGAACNATVSSGCSKIPLEVPTGAGVSFLAVDQSRHTLFALNSEDDTMSEINTRTCNGQTTAGCPRRARNEQVTFNPPLGPNPNGFALIPNTFALIPQTGTAYLLSVDGVPADGGGEPFLAAISIERCNALETGGCRREAPSLATGWAYPVLDPATDTIYALGGHGIVVVNGATCDVRRRSGCAPVARIPFDALGTLGAIDESTHTLYASDTPSNTVSAIDIKKCNAHNTSGCSAKAAKITVGGNPYTPLL